jgi:hypothetical protein
MNTIPPTEPATRCSIWVLPWRFLVFVFNLSRPTVRAHGERSRLKDRLY